MAGIIDKIKGVFEEKIDPDWECPELMYGFTVTYHAGCMGEKANSLESVSEYIFHGAKCIELDVSFQPDGTPVIIHESEPRFKQGESLDMALKIIAGSRKCKINLDLKSVKNLPAIDALVHEYNLKERVFYTGVGEEWVPIVKQNSFIPFYLNHLITPEEVTDKDIGKALVERVKAMGAIGVNSKYEKNCSAQLIKMMHRRDLYVSYWTVNSPSIARELVTCEVDNITSMKPKLLEKQIFGEVEDIGNMSVFGEEG